jgi:hypothetical protein
MSSVEREKRGKLGRLLAVVFVIALILGPGPGLRLINPDINDPNAAFTLFGLPKVYAWGLFWYGVELVIILTAYFKVWRGDDGDRATDEPKETSHG